MGKNVRKTEGLFTLLLILPLLFALWFPQPASISHILFIGNSITYHPAAVEQYNWHGAWGMNASAAHLDYDHQVWAGVAARQGDVPEMGIIRAVSLEDMLTTSDDIMAYEPDLLVVQWGEAAPYDMPQEEWDTVYRKIKKAAGATAVVAVGMWGTHEIRDKEDKLRIAALNAGILYVPIRDLHAPRTAEMCAGLHLGVCNHPDDSEMAALAGRILAAIYGQSTYLPLVHGKGDGTVPPK